MSSHIVITGLPRSGTSFLCHLLNQQPNVAILNEPPEVFRILLKQWWQLRHPGADRAVQRFAAYCDTLSERIASGEPLPNKLTQDTRETDERVDWVAGPAGNITLTGTKNTLAYTLSLGILRKLPCRIVATVRHPCDSIGSWQVSTQKNLAHLREGRLAAVRHVAPGALSDSQQARLEALERLPAGSLERLAAMWNLLANQYLEYRDAVDVVRYEDLVDAPEKILRDLSGNPDAGVPSDTTVRKKSYALDDESRERIWAACGPAATELGYSSP